MRKTANKLAAEAAMTDLHNWLMKEDPVEQELHARVSFSDLSVVSSFVGQEESIHRSLKGARKIQGANVKRVEFYGKIAIYDATNSTRDRRNWILRTLISKGFKVIFIGFVDDR